MNVGNVDTIAVKQYSYLLRVFHGKNKLSNVCITVDELSHLGHDIP